MSYRNTGWEILHLLAFRPRSTATEICKALDLCSVSATDNTLYRLRAHGLIRQTLVSRKKGNKYVRTGLWSLVPLEPCQRPVYDEHAETISQRIVRFLHENSGEWTAHEIADAVGVTAKTSLSVYMRPLLASGVLEREQDTMSCRRKDGKHMDRKVYVYRLAKREEEQ